MMSMRNPLTQSSAKLVQTYFKSTSPVSVQSFACFLRCDSMRIHTANVRQLTMSRQSYMARQFDKDKVRKRNLGQSYKENKISLYLQKLSN